jgi:D-cysteine desulfhydrase family pyridoxal phosphate-dependent enzyme
MIMPPRQRFACLPTPIEELPRLSANLKGPKIWIKRDDLTGLALGGNKTRKLEFMVAEALANGARTLITAGAVQSNHCRQTAAAAARFGMECILILTGDQPTQITGNLLLDHLLGAEIFWTSKEQRDLTLKNIFELAWEQGRRPYLIPYGGSNPAGASAYCLAIQELLEQKADFDWVVFASSSGGTQAGMLVGSRLFGFRGIILGISVDEPEIILKSRVADLATETADFWGEKIIYRPEDVLVNSEFLGGGYGVLGNPERDAIKSFAKYEGILLDPVYTGRAAAGLIDLIRRGFFDHTDEILFWHTGGNPALFALQYQSLVES